MPLGFDIVDKMRQNLEAVTEYLLDSKITNTPWKKVAEKQLIDLGAAVLELSQKLREYQNIMLRHTSKAYEFFRSMLEHFESLRRAVNQIDTLVLGELRKLDNFNQFESNLTTIISQLGEQTDWEEDLELNKLRRPQRRRRSTIKTFTKRKPSMKPCHHSDCDKKVGTRAKQCKVCGHANSCCGGHKKKRIPTIDDLLDLLK